MVEIKATHKYPIPLGRTGENEAARIAFTLAPFEEVFPGGTPALLVKRKGDSAAYPVTLTVEGLTAYWTVTSADTDKAGFGQCELQWHLGDTLAKSNKFDFIVVPALEAGAEPPDEPSKRWFDVIQAQIGNLDDLTTEEKKNLVAAINEAARSGGGGSGAVTEADIENALGYKPIGAADVPVKSVNGHTGNVKGTFYVTVTQEDDNRATADKTAAEVYAAYTAGYAVYAIAKFSFSAEPYMLPLAFALSTSGTVVLGFGALGSNDPTQRPAYLVVAYTGFAWFAWAGTLARSEDIPTIPTALKNPYSLDIKIGDTTTSYDGSESKTVEIPAGGGTDESLGITGAAAGKIPKIKAVNAAGKPTAWEATALPNEAFIVYFTQEIQLEGDPILTSDRTPEEVITAIASKKLVIALLEQDNKVTQLCNIANNGGYLYFFTIGKAGDVVGIGWNIERDMEGGTTYTLTTMAPWNFIGYNGVSGPYQIFGTGELGGYEFKQHIGFENLPGVTTSDNGKFMRVVNGAWKAAEMPESGPTDAQVNTAVSAWLTEHPEATTTVQDGSVSVEKLGYGKHIYGSKPYFCGAVGTGAQVYGSLGVVVPCKAGDTIYCTFNMSTSGAYQKPQLLAALPENQYGAIAPIGTIEKDDTTKAYTVPASATTTKAMYLPQNFVGIPAANNGSVEDALAWINNTMGTDGSKCAQNVPFEDYDAWYQTAQAELFDIDERCNKLMYASLYQAVSKLVGAKVAVLGDSLTEQSACSFITSAYNDRWMENVLRDTARTGDDGKTYKGSGWFALIARKYKIKWWCAGHGAQWWYSTTERPNGATAMVRKLIDGTDEFDYIVLEYGTNDILSGYTHIGTAADEASETATTSCGAIKWCIEQLQTRFPEVSIVVILPNIHSGANGEAPATQQAYLDAVVPILKKYGVRRVNMAEDSGIVKSMMYTDGVHLRWPVVSNNITYYTNDTPTVRKFSKCLEAELLKA